MKQNFTREDLSCAGTILACKGRKDKFGKPLYDSSFWEWAISVMRYFARAAWEQVKRGASSLKEAYRKVFASTSRLVEWVVPEGVTGSRLRKVAPSYAHRGIFNLVNVLV